MAQQLERVAVVGASLAGLNAAETLRGLGFSGGLTIVGAEASPPYDRPPLSKQLLTGEWGADRLPLRSGAELEALQLDWRLGRRAASLDLAARRLYLEDGEPIEFDGLIIATGAAPITLPGSELEGVHTLRTDTDALAIRADFERGGPLAVVGAGFIGAEAAASARARGAGGNADRGARRPDVGAAGRRAGGIYGRSASGAGGRSAHRAARRGVDGPAAR